jgi:hypothetical protein
MANNEINDATDATSAAPAGTQTGTQMAQAYAGAWGANGVFTPGIPLPPFADAAEKPRVFDYQSGINLYMTPRSGYGQMPFAQLKNFADVSDAVRIVIEAVKREIRSLEWDIQKGDLADKTDYAGEIDALRAFWRKPDGMTEFDAWCNAVLEDLLVYDAVSLWIDQDAGGQIVSVEQIDGSTIRPLLDQRGRIPRAPVPAYMQAIKGRNWQWFTADRLLYRPFNTSASSPYGKSPIEFLILRINEALRRQFAATSYWDTTNVPEAFAFLPSDWTPEQIETFQNYIDALLAGNVEKLRRIKFLPSPGGGQPVYEFRRPDAAASNAFDEWMLRMTCYAFGFLPSELGLVAGAGLGGKGFLEGQENSMYRFGIGPLTQYLQNLFTGIVQRQTKLPLVWRFVNIGPEEDKAAAAALMQTQLQNGVIDINVWRAKEGQPAIANAKPFIIVSGAPILLDDLFNPPPPAVSPAVSPLASPPAQLAPFAGDDGGDGADAPQDDTPASATAKDDVPPAFTKLALDHWREKSVRRLWDGKKPDCEPPAVSAGAIPLSVQKRIRGALALANNASDINKIFRTRDIPKALTLSKGEQHPTAGRRKIEDGMTDDLAAKLALISGALAAGDQAQAEAIAADNPELWHAYIDALAASQGRSKRADDPAPVPPAASSMSTGASFWQSFIVILLPAVFVWLLRSITHGTDEARGRAGDAPGVISAGLRASVDWSLVNTAAESWARANAGRLIKQLQATTVADIRVAVADWIKAGEALPALTQRVNALIDDPKRARLIAQSETTNAFAAGNHLAWEAAGVWGNMWNSVQDDGVCPVCGRLVGQMRPIGSPFVDPETDKRYERPGAHPGCRCYVVPVLEKPDGWDEETGLVP